MSEQISLLDLLRSAIAEAEEASPYLVQFRAELARLVTVPQAIALLESILKRAKEEEVGAGLRSRHYRMLLVKLGELEDSLPKEGNDDTNNR